MGHVQEIDALQRFVWEVAKVKSMKLSGAPPTVTRPVILWEHPRRGKQRNINRYTYTVQVQQFGRLFVETYDQAATIEETLLTELEERYGVLDVFEAEGSLIKVARLKAVTLEFRNSEAMDIPFTLTYEATYSRRRPEPAPALQKINSRVSYAANEQGG